MWPLKLVLFKIQTQQDNLINKQFSQTVNKRQFVKFHQKLSQMQWRLVKQIVRLERRI